MRQMNLMQSMAALFATGLFMTAAPALATPANFAPLYGFESAGLEGLPSFNFDSTSFLGAGEAGGLPVDVELRGSSDVCILFGDSTCREDTAGITGAYSVIVSIEVSDTNTELIGGADFTLFLSGVVTGDYTPAEVQIELNPVVLAGLDMSAVPGFEFDGSFDTYSHLVYTSGSGSTYDYIGWNTRLGDRISFQYNVLAAPEERGTPQLMANATAVVPEPGAALLMGLGLAGLASVNRGSKRRRITID